MKFGTEAGQHYTDYVFNVYTDGTLHKNVSLKTIENGITGKKDADLAVLRITHELFKYRCVEHQNRNTSNRATIAAFAVDGVNAMVELINDADNIAK